MKKSILIFAGLILAMALSVAWADETEEGDSALQLGEVVVTATKSSINKRETGASITVITEKEIEQKGQRMVIDALKGVPGLTITQQGMAGGISSVFMRGAAPRNLLVLVDGVRVNDPTSPDGAYNFADLTADNIERIEVIRGAQSALHGSDATAGVINIITKKGRGDNTLTLSAEGGSFRTFREYAGFHGGDDKANYSFSLSRTDSAGISQVEKTSGVTEEPEKDRYENTTATANIGGAVISDTWLSIALRYSDALADIDGFHPVTYAPSDDPNNIQRTRQFSVVTMMEQDITRWWSQSIIGNYMSVLRNGINDADHVDPDFSHDYYQGTQRRLEWRHKVLLYGINEVAGGIEYQDETMSSIYSHSTYGTSYFGEEKVYSTAFYLQNHLKLFERVFFIAGLRLTDHESFGTNLDYQFSGSVIVPFIETRLKGNCATGFKAPLLYQLYVDDPFIKGNKNLKPEESKSFDIGLVQPLWQGKITIEAGYYRNKYRNLIDTEGSPSVYVNKHDAEMEGYEGALTIIPSMYLRITGGYTYLKEAREGDDEMRLIRRPKHQGSVNLNLFVFNSVNLNAGMIYTGERDDIQSSNRVTMDDYLLFNVAVSVNFMEKFQMFARCENITDEHYQDVLGYKRPGRSFYGGAKGTF